MSNTMSPEPKLVGPAEAPMPATKKRVAVYTHMREPVSGLHAPETIRHIFQLHTDACRIVTVVSEVGVLEKADGVGGPVLRKLMKRMLSGEFESIVASFSQLTSDGGPRDQFILTIEPKGDVSRSPPAGEC